MRVFGLFDMNVDDEPNIIPSAKYSVSRVIANTLSIETNEANFGDGYIQSAGQGFQDKREVYELTWNNRHKDTINEIYDFFREVGTSETFWWRNSASQKWLKVKLSGEVSKSRQVNIGTIKATFREVFEL